MEVTIRVIRASLDACATNFGLMDLFTAIDWQKPDGFRWRVCRTETLWMKAGELVWEHECPPRAVQWPSVSRTEGSQEGGGEEVVIFDVMQERWGGYASPALCGSTSASVRELLGGVLSKPTVTGPVLELALLRSGDLLGTISVQASAKLVDPPSEVQHSEVRDLRFRAPAAASPSSSCADSGDESTPAQRLAVAMGRLARSMPKEDDRLPTAAVPSTEPVERGVTPPRCSARFAPDVAARLRATIKMYSPTGDGPPQPRFFSAIRDTDKNDVLPSVAQSNDAKFDDALHQEPNLEASTNLNKDTDDWNQCIHGYSSSCTTWLAWALGWYASRSEWEKGALPLGSMLLPCVRHISNLESQAVGFLLRIQYLEGGTAPCSLVLLFEDVHEHVAQAWRLDLMELVGIACGDEF